MSFIQLLARKFHTFRDICNRTAQIYPFLKEHFFNYNSIFFRYILYLLVQHIISKRIAIGMNLSKGIYHSRDGPALLIDNHNWIFESWMDKVYEREFDFSVIKDWIIIDVGAGIGEYSLRCAMKKAKKVVAFEPSPEHYAKLSRNAVHYKSIDPICFAISDKKESVIFFQTHGSAGHSMLHEPKRYKVSYKVQTISLDEYLKDFNKVDLLKIDVDGAEEHVLNGAINLLEITQRIVMEIHSKTLLHNCVKLLSRYGFTIKMNQEEKGSDFYIIYGMKTAQKRSKGD